MAEAEPALEMAAQALKNIRREDIAEIRGFANPAESVKKTCICVLNLRPGGDEDTSEGWKAAQKMMSKTDFLSNLVKYLFKKFLFLKEESPRTILQLRTYFEKHAQTCSGTCIV